MSPSDLDETSAEISEWDEFYTSVTKYGFSKTFQKENIVLPVAILDETADSKETVLKVLNILNDKFQVGQLTNYVVVVGDGKSYDHLIKLKSEYGENMDWVLAYPGDWHILKNVLPIFVKIYFDAGLKQLATKHHHGATLKVLTECSKFAITHRQNYQRLIPYHLADLHTFPEPVIKHFAAGCFSVSISGKHLYSVALDEAHEMEINLKSKMLLTLSASLLWLISLFYLPYRAKTLHNLKSELQLEREEGLYQREGTMSYVKMQKKQTETDHEQTDSLINYRKYGEEDLGNYLKCFLFRTCETAGKPPPRKRRNLKTFAPIKITIHKQKKEIKDQNTVISCLRKKIAFSKHSGNAVKDLDQFLQLPRALCDAEGIPEKGQKATAANVFKNIYYDAFLLQVPKAPVSSKTTVIIDGMFIINTSPLASHQTFGDYGEFLFNRWIIKYYNQYTANEVHLLFDDPNRNGVSPKDIERTRRNTVVQEPVVRTCISSDTPLLSNWRNFIAVRHQKRLLVNFLSEYFLSLSLTFFSTNQCCFVTAGGFDDDRKDRAISILNGQVVDYDLASGNHEEADTRVWLHASVTTADQVIIYSPDTDVFFIGLPLVPNLTKTVYVQLRDSPYNNSFLSMDKLVKCITLNDSLLQGIDSIFDMYAKVEKTVEWYTKGCGCKTGCKTNRCKCKKAQNDNCDGFCGPGCKCVNCFNVPGSGDQVLDMSIDLDDVISDETEDLEDPVEDEQPEVDGLVEELDQTDDYWLFSNEEI
ncbi:unnamed protein product [Mytilus coruscus]|uniref:Tesmin/TSO1-like CXC domain-containing protein n=1 Tax=Mytilus coruscus TaxID=42192 RepID=A0A6J8EFA7_MYTCO|nr:unnamed protein product [Mytilus coruscus]